jgi:hypothetical protein
MNLVVSDTGPLLYLHQVSAMHLLAHLGSVVGSAVGGLTAFQIAVEMRRGTTAMA